MAPSSRKKAGSATPAKRARTESHGTAGKVTVDDMLADPVTALANKLWAPGMLQERKLDEDLVARLYNEELGGGSAWPEPSRMQILDYSCYLENYLWPNWGENCSKSHTMSVILLGNEKVSQGTSVNFWDSMVGGKGSSTPSFPSFLGQCVEFYLSREGTPAMSALERVSFIRFLVNVFQSLEQETVREAGLPFCSLSLWGSLSTERRERLFNTYPPLLHYWKQMQPKSTKRTKKGTSRAQEPASEDKTAVFLPKVARDVLDAMKEAHQRGSDASSLLTDFAECGLELLTDLMSQLPTRRFLREVLLELHVVENAQLLCMGSTKNLGRLVDGLSFMMGFEVDDQTGAGLTDAGVTDVHLQKIHEVQRLVFKDEGLKNAFPELPFESATTAGRREYLEKELGRAPLSTLVRLAQVLGLFSREDGEKHQHSFVLSVLVNHLSSRESQLQQVNGLALCPNEQTLWDEGLLALGRGSEAPSRRAMGLPKLNLQFLTLRDYLLRNFQLYRLESAHAIREDMEDTVVRVNAFEVGGEVSFRGWARMAAPVVQETCRVTAVEAPKIGHVVPSEVLAEVSVDLSPISAAVRSEWDKLREHDVVFLLRVGLAVDEEGATAPQKIGVDVVRGAELVSMTDESGTFLQDPRRNSRPASGTRRTLRIKLDSAQYREDLLSGNVGLYDTFNLVVRRPAAENNFRGVLETIRDLMNSETDAGGSMVPHWLHDVLLGYGDPSAASPPNDSWGEQPLAMADTFLDVNHVREAFPGKNVIFRSSDGHELGSDDTINPPFQLQKVGEDDPIIATPYEDPRQPSLRTEVDFPARHNSVRFTPMQIRAIASAMRNGLTLIIGPPGTGKTDVAVQVASNLYHANPKERTLLITHSNGALNDIFEKIMERNIDERHMLRLGSGERDLETAKDFSRLGRVNHCLVRRLELLKAVQQMGLALGAGGDPGSTCETAGIFFRAEVEPRLRLLEAAVADTPENDTLDFPVAFATYAANQGTTVPAGLSPQSATTAIKRIRQLFEEIADYQAFEVLRTHSARADYLLTTQAKIVAMTCTHAALVRRRLVSLRFAYETVVMEESAQMLEIETLIPLLLQVNTGRLKRIVLIGDHHQLPPVIRCQPLQAHCRLEQSLFSRLVRLGTPTVQLDLQGRARPEIAALYSWRYNGVLGNLDAVSHSSYALANAGFRHSFQAVDVAEFGGAGETSPTAHFFQNLGEAEYVAATYQYMRLLGYPSEKITVLTTYKGQCALLRDVFAQRCAGSPLFGMPACIETVDKYQGQQNDYCLLSLVRTKAVGHLRDPRRLVVALSRARLGLYVFCKVDLFAKCFELMPSFAQFLQRPCTLQLALNEKWPSERSQSAAPVEPFEITEGVTQMGILVHGMASIALGSLNGATSTT
jgi:intron-binding protein aquarius